MNDASQTPSLDADFLVFSGMGFYTLYKVEEGNANVWYDKNQNPHYYTAVKIDYYTNLSDLEREWGITSFGEEFGNATLYQNTGD